MSNEAREQLRQQFEVIRDERRKNANTAERIGNAFLSLLSYLDIAFDIPTLDISKINGLQAELDKKLNKTDFGASFATEMAKWFAKDSDGNKGFGRQHICGRQKGLLLKQLHISTRVKCKYRRRRLVRLITGLEQICR